MIKKKDNIYFNPTGQFFESKSDFDDAYIKFSTGELDEGFMQYCSENALHAFWYNYKNRENKVSKEVFCQKFKELINQMLKEL